MVEAIIEGMIEAIENADDSNGEIGGCLNSAFGVLSQLAESGLDEPLHDEMFNWLLHHHEAKTMKGWNWHTDLMEIAINMVRTKEEKERIRTDLEQIKPNGKDWDWSQIDHQSVAEGGILELWLGNTPEKGWGKQKYNVNQMSINK